MAERINWILDFDETLASSGITWAIQHAFPQMIRDHQLPHNAVRLNQAVLVAQERGSREADPRPILSELFATMEWPHELEEPLLRDIMTSYQPELFEDTLPFLEQVRARGHAAYIVSNNPLTIKHAELLQLGPYVAGVFTPKIVPNSQPKPHRSLWDQIVQAQPEIGTGRAIIVGDDPWSDGLFAENCGLSCWIVDRMNRFTTLYDSKPYSWVQTLRDIPVGE